jgi:hypothetical protein
LSQGVACLAHQEAQWLTRRFPTVQLWLRIKSPNYVAAIFERRLSLFSLRAPRPLRRHVLSWLKATKFPLKPHPLMGRLNTFCQVKENQLCFIAE